MTNDERMQREMNAEQYRQNRQTIAARLAQLLNRENARQQFGKSVEVVKLAIELARLKGSQATQDFLGEATQLLAGADRALAQENELRKGEPERARQQYEAREAKAMARFDERSCLSFAEVVRGPGEPKDKEPRRFEGKCINRFKPERIEVLWKRPVWKTFVGLVQDHLRAFYDEAVKTIPAELERLENLEKVKGGQPDGLPLAREARARAVLDSYAHTAKHIEELAAAKSKTGVQTFLANWRPWAEEETVDQWKARTKAGELNIAELAKLAECRGSKNTTKTKPATKAAAAKRAKIRETKEPKRTER